MSSPFVIFRRHQRVLMVVVTGLSMISFVLLGAIQDPREVPAPLIVLFLAAMAGGLAWLAGMNRGKGSEWGLTGAVLGAAIGLGAMFLNREASAVLIDNGNISDQQLSELRRQRYAVNRFVSLAFQQSFGIGLHSLPPQMQRSYVFGLGNSEEASIQDVVLGEILRREADRMGIVISDKMVTDFIKRVTSKEGLLETFEQVKGQMNPQEAAMYSFYLPQIQEKPMTAEAFTRIRQSLIGGGISELALISAIREELKANQAYQLMAGNNYFPPEQFWEFYRQLNVKQSAEIASVAVKDFIDLDAKPTESELLALFEKYRGTVAGFTPEGVPAPGQPGFVQPRRIKLGYLQAVYEQIEPLVGTVSDEEIQKLYEEKYLKAVPAEDASSGLNLDLNNLNLNGPDLPAPKADMPAEKAADKPLEKPADKTEEKPADKPADKTPEPASATRTEEKKSDKPAEKPAETTDKPAEKPVEEKPAETPAKPDEAPKADPSSSLMLRLNATQQVAFLQDEPAASDKPAADKPADDKPAESKPAESKPEAPKPAETPAADAPAKTEDKPAEKAEEKSAADAKPAGDAKPATDKPTDKPAEESKETVPAAPTMDAPPAPKAEIPPLDDALKAELREDILRERTRVEIQKRIEAAQEVMIGISEKVQRDPSDNDYLSPEDAHEQLKFYAGQNQLAYVVTPALSYEEMVDSEEYPIGRASLQDGMRMLVADTLFRSAATDLYRVNSASDFNSLNSFVFWKLSDKEAYQPKSIDDEPGIRAAVLEAWNLEQARPKAQARAEALAKLVRESDKPMGEALAEQTTTGTENSLFIPVRVSGEFTWMQKPIVPSTGMMQSQPVRPSVIPEAPDAGDEFFNTVFNELQVGDTGVAPNDDHTVFYVVKIDSRDPSTPEQLEAARQKFLEQGIQQSYSSLLQQKLSQNSVNWLQQLFNDHKVEFLRQD